MAANATHFPPIVPQPGFADILRESVAYGSTGATGPDGADSTGEKINGWFDRLMVQSGVDVSPAVLLMLCIASAVALGGLVFVVQENLFTTALAALLGGVLPVATALVARRRRQKTILRQMPNMIGELARAARAGRSLPQCLHMVAEDTPSPLGGELRLCDRRLQMGVSLPEAIEPLPERTGVMTLRVLVTALSVHHQTGGNLVEVLERLQRTIRDRLAFLGRLQTATAASRATALMMLILPPAILAFFIVREPSYFTELMDSTWGRGFTIAAFALQIIGSAWVLRILRNSQRT
jgi:tight adherence protein B